MENSKEQKMTEVILKNGKTVEAADVLENLIASEVSNTIANNTDEFDLVSSDGIRTAAEAIADYLELVTKESIDVSAVESELKVQLYSNK